MRTLTLALVFACGFALTGCPQPSEDDDDITPTTPEDEVIADFSVERALLCAGGGWSTTAQADATQYELYSCFSPSNLTDAVYDVSDGGAPVWQSDGSTDGTFTAYTNPMYGIVETTSMTAGSN